MPDLSHPARTAYGVFDRLDADWSALCADASVQAVVTAWLTVDHLADDVAAAAGAEVSGLGPGPLLAALRRGAGSLSPVGTDAVLRALLRRACGFDSAAALAARIVVQAMVPAAVRMTQGQVRAFGGRTFDDVAQVVLAGFYETACSGRVHTRPGRPAANLVLDTLNRVCRDLAADREALGGNLAVAEDLADPAPSPADVVHGRAVHATAAAAGLQAVCEQGTGAARLELLELVLEAMEAGSLSPADGRAIAWQRDDRARAAQPVTGTTEAPAPLPAPTTTPASAGAQSSLPAPPATAHVLAAPGRGQAESNDASSGPSVLLLGPLAVEGAAGEVDSNRRRTSTELIAYLALNPGGDHHALDDALWPGQIVSKSVRNAVISRTRTWLGAAPDGNAHFPRIQDTGDNRYRLARTVTCDWTLFQRHSRQGLTDQGEDGDLALRRALALVRGRPFAGTDSGRYTWAEHAIQGMVSEITHTAYELSTRRLEARDIPGALWAARRGLLAGQENETLHRCIFRAHHAAGDIEALRASAAQLTRINHELGDIDMEDATSLLLQTLLPRPALVR